MNKQTELFESAFIPKVTSPTEELDSEELKALERRRQQNTLNDLSGKEWLYFTRTLITKVYPSEFSHDLRKEHGGNKPPRLMAELISFFTKKGQRLLDPFAGVGGTLIGATITGREAVGIELNPRWIELYKRVCKEEVLKEQKIIQGDCRVILHDRRVIKRESFDFIATDPPYGLNFERTMSDPTTKSKAPSARHKLRRTDFVAFSDEEADFSNLSDFPSYFAAMKEVSGLLLDALKPGKYMAIILRNSYQDGRYIMTHARVAQDAEEVGWIPKGEIIWYVPGTRLRPYGYPTAYIPNIAHQYILIFQKPPRRRRRAAVKAARSRH